MDKAKIQLSTCNSKLSSVCCVKTNHKKVLDDFLGLIVIYVTQ